MRHTITFVALTIVLAACAQFGVPAPQGFMQKAAAAQVTVTALRQTATDSLNANLINVDQAKAARAVADGGNQAIDVALVAYQQVCPQPASGATCDSPAATAKLDAAIVVVSAAKTLLDSYKGK